MTSGTMPAADNERSTPAHRPERALIERSVASGSGAETARPILDRVPATSSAPASHGVPA